MPKGMRDSNPMPSSEKKAWCKFRSQSPLQLFAWVVILTIFIFYCIPKSKRSVYLLPIYPFMGMLLAEYLLALVTENGICTTLSLNVRQRKHLPAEDVSFSISIRTRK